VVWSDILDLDEEELLSLFYHSFETSQRSSTINKDNSENEQRRYFMDTRICYKCGKTGHIDSQCPDRVKQLCILCGCIDHQRYNCYQIICLNCNKHGHRVRDCKEKVDQKSKFSTCNKCPGRHTVRDCPITWRRYKIYDLDNRPIKMSCSNCFANDHFLDDCFIKRSKSSIFTKRFMEMVQPRGSNFRSHLNR
ncbi:E3 ubiquitin ligase interacting with arginine methyltransferase, partial [Pseudoloma neurophilia]